MIDHFFKFYYFSVLTCVLLFSAFCKGNFQNEESFRNILDERLESDYKSRRQLNFGSENLQDSGEIGSDEDEITQSHNVSSVIPPEAWTGRWFPDKVTQSPHHVPTKINPQGSGESGSEEGEITQSHNISSVIPPEAWTGRWFPEKVTQSPHQIPTEINSQDSGESGSEEEEITQSHNVSSVIPPEAWTGRWFPEKVTQSPHQIQTEINSQDSGESGSEEDEITQSHNVSSVIPPEAWTGRWFPEKVTQSPHQIQKKINSQDSENSWLEEDEITQSHNVSSVIRPEDWTGRWFPDKVTQPPHHQIPKMPSQEWTGKWFPPHRPNTLSDIHFNRNEVPYDTHMWKMVNSSCDDGKTNLTVDWNGSPINYTCLNPHQYFSPDYDIPSIIIKSLIPETYRATHECMNNEIHYTSDLPTFGTHRPAWPKYGEYQFVPKQRWIHSLEHGAIVMLYHPCAHPQLVQELRELVTRCLYRHVITPYTLLPHDRPFALLSWGWALLMSAPEENTVKTFIIDHAKKGPEALSKDGQFSEGLLRPAAIVSDAEDSRLCPMPALF